MSRPSRRDRGSAEPSATTPRPGRLAPRVAAVTALATVLALAALAALAPFPLAGSGASEPPAPQPATAPEREARAEPPTPPSPRPRAAARPPRRARRPSYERVVWRRSQAIGTPNAGALVGGVKLPSEGRHFFTWDPDRLSSASPRWRRYGTARLIRVILRVAEDFARAHPSGPRMTVGDLSRPRGGDFGARHSPRLPHVSHQNGLDVDIFYPRRDRAERAPGAVAEVDLKLSQDLVDRFVRAGAQMIFVGLNTPLAGPPGIVQAAARHDDHLHVRLPPG